MDSLRQEKIQKFEEFVDRLLKPDLVRAISERDKVFDQQRIFSDLRKNMEILKKNSVTNLRTVVNIGSEVYMQAEGPDTMYICGYRTRVSCGVHLVRCFKVHVIEGGKAGKYFFSIALCRQIEEYTRLIASIKAQIKLVCEGICELLQMPEEKTAEGRIF